ncbi:MAG: DUF1287 domain-containing protein [Hyphomicrobiaceae bacterium]|nr:DUF1287 domain-containing protein [Hyphomicrobiaceae bacterium]
MPSVAAVAAGYSRDDRDALALLLMPFVLLAAAIALSSGIHFEKKLRSVLAERAPASLPSRAAERALQPNTEPPAVIAARPGAAEIAAARPEPAPSVAPMTDGARVAAAPPVEVRGVDASTPGADLASDTAGVTAGVPIVANAAPPTAIDASKLPTSTTSAAPPAERVAAIDATIPPEGLISEREEPSAIPAPAIPPSATLADPAAGNLGGPAGSVNAAISDPRCIVAAPALASVAVPANLPSNIAGFEFGRRLAAAAMSQLDQFTIYNDAYRRISYPGGDVSGLYGVCTDVVIRAYRALGVDLQVAVQRARVGSGDTNIDHRRTETLRRFFVRAGQSLPVTSYGEDYEPGDIVTYDRPQNSGSRSHIAVVSDRIGPSGAPMIVHNRGWGPQLEDGLFVDRITGHYRYDGHPPIRQAGADTAAAQSPQLGSTAGFTRTQRPLLAPAKARREHRSAPARHTSARQAVPGGAQANSQRTAMQQSLAGANMATLSPAQRKTLQH